MNNAEGSVYDYCLAELKKAILAKDLELAVWYCDTLDFISDKQLAELEQEIAESRGE